MPSRQTERNRRQDMARLQAIADAVDAPLRVEHDGAQYVLKDGTLRVFAGRHEVVAAFLTGVAWARPPFGASR